MSRNPKDEDESTDQSEPAYKVGYGKPPVETRFKPGNNANLKGRPRKQSKTLKELLEETVEATKNGRVHKLTMLEAIFRRLIQDAAKGNVKSIAFVLSLMSQNEAKNGNEETVFPESHREMLNRYIEAIRRGDKVGPEVNDPKPKGITK